MREIRARISQRHGIDLTTQQIQELAARRLEAILDPRTVKPSLLEQLRRSAGAPVDTKPVDDSLTYTFDETTLYETHRGFLRFMRRLLQPILKLFFNPNPLIEALNTQTRINQAALAREAERERRQAEWNALHYEILQRLVLEVSRASLEAQGLAMRVESLAAKVDFNERRVRGIENQLHQARPSTRPAEPIASPQPAAAPQHEAAPPQATQGEAPAEGGRRRRRRRRGRRPSGGPFEGVAPAAVAADASAAPIGDAENEPELDDDEEDAPELESAPGSPAAGEQNQSIESTASSHTPEAEAPFDPFAPAVMPSAPIDAPSSAEQTPSVPASTGSADAASRDPHEPSESGGAGQ